MKVIVESPFNLKDDQEKHIVDQVKSMTILDDSITNSQVYFKKDDGEKGDTIVAEVQLHIPGQVLFASDQNQQFMVAFSSALDKVKRQLIKAKELRRKH